MPSPEVADGKHRWKFFRAGGFDQVSLESGSDLAALDELDQKLWVALSCPTKGLEFDVRTLALLDADKDGRIRVPEIVAATKWACSCLKNPDDLLNSAGALPLSAINDETDEGKLLLGSVRQILANLGKADATEISVGDTADTVRIFAQTHFNGDGIVPAEAASDDATRAVINDIIASVGSEPDRSGKPGINQQKVDRFFAEAEAFSGWWKQTEAAADSVLPLGEATTAAVAALEAVRAKVDDYFTRCRLAEFDPRSLGALNRLEGEYVELAMKDLSSTADELSGFPLARVEAKKPLPLEEGVNPAWAGAVTALKEQVVKPILGDKTSLAADEWAILVGKLSPFVGWQLGKAGAAVEGLGLARVREILGGDSKAAIEELIAKDNALADEADTIDEVEKLVHYHRHLFTLLCNFVNFRDFYDRQKAAVFQAGTLYLDQRSCDLCLRVDDAAAHAKLAGMAKMCLAYCDCTRPGSGEKVEIMAAFTDGDSDNLMVGRNGIFYDRKGRDWDATVTKVIDNPISVRQAFWSPYKKFIRMLEEQVAKRAAAAEAAATTKLESAAAATVTADKAVPAAKPAAAPGTPPKRFEVGTIAALGVGVGAIATVVGGFIAGFLGLGWWMPLGVAGILLLISCPSMVIAWLKLRQRNLGPILDASGWAVNARAKINVPFGGSLTGVAKLPAGAQRDLRDPFADSHAGRDRIIAAVVLLGLVWVLWFYGLLHGAFPGLPKSSHVRTSTSTSPST